MKITMYRTKIDKNTYISGSSIQTTKDRYLALCSEAVAIRNVGLVDSAIVEEVVLDCTPCTVGGLEFGIGDTFSHTSINGLIIHSTKAYIWTVKLDKDNMPISGSVEKHRLKDANTRDFNSGKGFKIA